MPQRKYIGTENLIGQRIVSIRKQKGMNQKTLLARIQVRGVDLSQSALSEIEGQRRKVSDRELRVIAESLSVSVETLTETAEQFQPL